MLKPTNLALTIAGLISVNAHADDPAKIETVVVTATRTDSGLLDTAAPVTVIDDQTIEKDMITGLDDLFKYTPGVTVETNSRQGVQSINIRGIEGNRIKVLVDGVSQGNQFASSASFINSSRVEVDTDLVKSVEIVKGAASALQGSDAIGGVVAFETKDPVDFLQGGDIGGHAKFNYSSQDNTFSESVALANQFGALQTLVAYTRRDGEQLDNFADLDEEDSQNNNLLVKLHYQATANHRLELNGNFINNANQSDQVYRNYSDARADDTTEQYQIGIKHIWDLQASLADTVTWQFDWLDKEDNGVTKRVKNSNTSQQRKDYIYRDEGYQFDIQLDKQFSLGSTEHYLIYGASYQDKDIENINKEINSIGADREIFYIPSANERRYGLFLQNEISIGNLTITPGLRYDWFETDPGDTSKNPSGNTEGEYKKYSDSALTGRLGAIYRLNPQHRVFAQVSQGFRAPDFKELFYSYGNPVMHYYSKPNPDLKAEESLSYELGWRHNGEHSNTEIALFYSQYDNFITTKGEGQFRNPINPYIMTSVNTDEATIKGIELSNQLSWNGFMPIKGFSSRLAAAYTEGEDGEDNPLNDVNPWNLVFGINYDDAVWGASLTFNHVGSKNRGDIHGDDILTLGSVTVTDLTAYFRPVKRLTLRAGVFNLTDEEYYNWNDVRDVTEENKSLTQAGRNWAVTVKYDF